MFVWQQSLVLVLHEMTRDQWWHHVSDRCQWVWSSSHLVHTYMDMHAYMHTYIHMLPSSLVDSVTTCLKRVAFRLCHVPWASPDWIWWFDFPGGVSPVTGHGIAMKWYSWSAIISRCMAHIICHRTGPQVSTLHEHYYSLYYSVVLMLCLMWFVMKFMR